MKVATVATNTLSSRPNIESAFRRMFDTLCAELRRRIQLAGEKYQHGLPTLWFFAIVILFTVVHFEDHPAEHLALTDKCFMIVRSGPAGLNRFR